MGGSRTAFHGWTLQQGQRGINVEARSYLREMIPANDPTPSNAGARWVCDPNSRQLYQANVQKLTESKTPFKRLLVAWSMGMGKTRTIVDVLDNYYNDERPKIFLAPNKSLANNFYTELLDKRYPNQYQNWVQETRKTYPSTTRGQKNDVEMLECRVRYLDVKSMPGDIRAMEYKQLDRTGTQHADLAVLWSARAVKQRQQFMRGEVLHGLDACVIVIDEAHLLLPYKQLCKQLTESRNTVIVMFTGTPMAIPRPPKDLTPKDRKNAGSDISRLGSLDLLLCILAGQRPKDVVTDVLSGSICYEGYMSYMMDRTIGDLFAKTVPSLRALPEVHVVHMHPKFAASYARVRMPRPGASRCLGQTKMTRYCQPIREGLSSTHLEHANRPDRGKKIKTLQDAHMHAPKLAQVVQDIQNRNQTTHPEKTVIMIHRRSGLRVLQHILEKATPKITFVVLHPQKTRAIGRENDKKIRRFNDTKNANGEKVQVLIANEEHNEGLSTFDVRRIILVDQTDTNMPGSLALMRQRLARALRMCSHARIPERERILHMDLYVLDWDKNSRHNTPTIDMEKYMHIKNELANEDLTEEQRLYMLSIDGLFYGPPPGGRGLHSVINQLEEILYNQRKRKKPSGITQRNSKRPKSDTGQVTVRNAGAGG